MPTTVFANDGDTLCGLAIDAGFENCQPLRDEPLNQGRSFLSRPTLKTGDFVTIPDKKLKHEAKGVDTKHKFLKKTAPRVSVRFVHGSKDKKYLDDDTLTVLNVSNFVTNQAGADGTHAFPRGKFGFDADGDADVDAFKVEVVDPKASGSLNIVLEALKPAKQADGTTQFQSITGVPDAALRKIDPLQCKQVKAGLAAFRTPYLRLVVDQPDQAAEAGQTLLTADTVDAGDETLEILDQHVRASYEITRCPATPKCKASADLPIGTNRQRAKVAVHILQDPATGTALATFDQARKSVLKYVRQLYAQASMSVKVIGTIGLCRARPILLPSPTPTVLTPWVAGPFECACRWGSPIRPLSISIRPCRS